MAAVIGHGHRGDGADDPHFSGGRGAGHHKQDRKSYYEFLFTIFIQLL